MTLSLVPTDAHEALPQDIALPADGLGLDAVQERMRGAARLWFAVEDGVAVGLACFFDDTQTPEIGYGVSPACRGRGLAKTITAALQDMARTQGMSGLSAHSADENPASGAVLAAMGFDHVKSRTDPGLGLVHLWTWTP